MKPLFTLLVLALPAEPFAQDQPLPARVAPEEDSVNQKKVRQAPGRLPFAGHLTAGSVRQENMEPAQAYSRDIYLRLSSRYLRRLGYRSRGFGQPENYVNGIRVNPPGQPAVRYVSWGGLQYHLDIPVSTGNLASVAGSPSGLGGQAVWEFDPGQRKKETLLGYGFSNALPGHQLSLTYHSGPIKKGWAWSIAANKRWHAKGYRPGTFYEGYALYLGIRKKFGKKILVNWNTFAATDRRGLHQAATLEALSLSGDNYYNPAWGYQQGDIRNAVVAAGFLPESRLNMDWETGPHSLLRLSAALQWGYRQLSGLDWYNAPDPRPDYYKNLPSYFIKNNEPALAEQLKQRWETDLAFRQIAWQQLYNVNRTNYTTTNGTTGRRSLYVLGADRHDIIRYDLALQFRSREHSYLNWNAGMQFSSHTSRRYRKMLDLLGGDYFVNLNPFAERQYPNQPDLHQHNLLHPNEIIRTGDAYAYHYAVRNLHSFAWTTLNYEKSRLKAALSGRIGYSAYQRRGFYKHGIFPEDSYGPSKLLRFLSYQVHAGLRYRLNRQHLLWLRAGIGAQPPAWAHVFISPETRNTRVRKPLVEQQQMLTFGYSVQQRWLTLQLSGFTAQIRHASRILRFYHDAYHSSVNYVMQGIGQQHLGAELAIKLPLVRKLEILAAGSWKQVFYTSRPEISIYRDNAPGAIIANSEVYLKNYYAGIGPQTAGTAGVQYRPFPRSTVQVQANFTDRHFVEMNPSRLTEKAVEQIAAGSPTWNAILAQKRLPPAFTLDAYLRQGFRIKLSGQGRQILLKLQMGIKNGLNNKMVVQSAYQQLRFDFADRDPQTFPEKYRFLPGRIWYANFSIEF